MVYTRGQPIATDDLDISQPFLLDNTNSSDDSFGVDHYKFSNLTANNGFHNEVTTPVYVASPPTGLPPLTPAGLARIYGFQQTAPLGVLQYSRGPVNAQPTPITSLHSTIAASTILANTSITLLDFTGVTSAFFTVFAANMTATSSFKASAHVIWNGTSFFITPIITSTLFTFAGSGNNFQLTNNSPGSNATNMFWTIDFQRING